MSATQQSKDPVLVVLQLTGGNDYLNTVIPYNNGPSGRWPRQVRPPCAPRMGAMNPSCRSPAVYAGDPLSQA
jgi:uncharacterized protein (DUF1501 family)